jgi:hypothetical protein
MKSKLDASSGVVVYLSDRNRPEVELTPAPHLVNDGKANLRADEPGVLYAKANNSRLLNMRPSWR